MALAAAAGVAGASALGAYLNGKYQIYQDLNMVRKVRQGAKQYEKDAAADKLSLWYIFVDITRKYPNMRCIWTREREYSYQEIHDLSVRYARWLLSEGIQPGNVVAFYLQNSEHFMIIWLATHCIGVAAAFINYNLEGKVLLHCTDVVQSKLVIVEDEPGCRSRIDGSREALIASGTKIVILDQNLKNQIESGPVDIPEDRYRNGMKGEFPACIIYTSGTTGLPKGCAFTVQRLRSMGSHFNPPFNQKVGVDQWYNSMPMYHGTGGISSIMGILGGSAPAVAPRFSVSNFWPDVHNSGSTFFVYVGETARYLLNAPPHPLERDHKLRCGYGNGLRPDVWEKFKTRFNIPEIAEFFNSTEGVFTLLNYNTGPYTSACVGHHGAILRKVMQNIYIPVRIDHDTGDIWRDPATGFAQRTSYDEGGEMLVAVPNKQAFQGYWRSEAATEKRFSTDVFKKGDIFYRSGDSLRRTSDGHWHFLDRLGDTYRWKSENVSTAEVAEVLGRFPGVAEANVYGVLVPNHEGRAGCAAVHLDSSVSPQSFDYNALRDHAQQRLPKYAVPVFIRVVKASAHIHNHKQNKVPLRKEGVDPKATGKESSDGKEDTFLWLCPRRKRYVDFTEEDWASLEKGQIRL